MCLKHVLAIILSCVYTAGAVPMPEDDSPSRQESTNETVKKYYFSVASTLSDKFHLVLGTYGIIQTLSLGTSFLANSLVVKILFARQIVFQFNPPGCLWRATRIDTHPLARYYKPLLFIEKTALGTALTTSALMLIAEGIAHTGFENKIKVLSDKLKQLANRSKNS